ncbi:MAG: hypothetical protein Q4C98_11520 [Capnocytophaga sp.]|nr:hypothetical protein [Capnocytophaga sp.]
MLVSVHQTSVASAVATNLRVYTKNSKNRSKCVLGRFYEGWDI